MTETIKHDKGKVKARYMYWDALSIYLNKEQKEVCLLLEDISSATKLLSVEKLKKLLDLLSRDYFKNWCKLDPDEPWLLELARIAEHGAMKYGDHNYKLGTNWSRYVDAMCRHILAHWGGHLIDQDSGFRHLTHAIANILILMIYIDENIGTNDL